MVYIERGIKYDIGSELKHWIITVSEENWYVIKSSNVYGAPESQRFKSIHRLIKPGDIVIFYVKKKDSKDLGGKFVGAFKVISNWFREDKPLWPDEIREGRVKYPWRVRLEPVKLGVADFRELVPRLSFIEKKDKPGAYLVGTPANLRRPIPEKDAKTIIESLR